MRISTKDWKNYIDKLGKLIDIAAEKMQDYVRKNAFADTEALIEYAYALVTKYGEGSAELACQMYDAVAEMAGVSVESAVPAETATYQETARAVQGSLLQSETGQKLSQVAARLVKQAGADTTIKNAIRDGAEWAWVPMGDTCAFCITLASRGWQHASKKVLKGNHATHIHANCNCQFAIRFDRKSGVAGYDPDKYRRIYDNAEGRSSKDKVNTLRREHYAENKDKINTQKRAAYAQSKKTTLENSERSSTIDIEEIVIHKSVGAKAKNYDIVAPDTNEIYHFAEGTKIQNSEVFAGKGTKHPLHEGVAEGLSKQFGGTPEKWQHCKGHGVIDFEGEERKAEVHWFQEETVGKVKFKVKEWEDED